LYDTVVEIVRASETLALLIGTPLVLGDQIVGAIVDLKVDGGDDEGGLTKELSEMYLRTTLKMLAINNDPAAWIERLFQFAHFVVPVTGPGGYADVNVLATKAGEDRPWVLCWVVAECGQSQEQHDLLRERRGAP